MSNVLYTVNSLETLFDGKYDIENTRKEADCWYEGDDREKSLERETFGYQKTLVTMQF